MSLKEIDNVEITSLVDNNVDILLSDNEVAFRPLLNENWFMHSLIAEHGFCATIKETNGIEHKILYDSGLDPKTAIHNAEVLDLNLSSLDLVIKSWLY